MHICFTALIIVIVSFFFGWTLMAISPKLKTFIFYGYKNYQNFVNDIQKKHKETKKHDTKKRK